MSEQSRRSFLKNAALIAAAVPCAGLLGRTTEALAKTKAPAPVPLPAGQTAVDENDSIASALGFHHDAKKTDYSRYPDRKKASAKNDFCKNCLQYTALNEGWGKCNVITSGVVSAQGWCGSWSAKT